MELSNQFEVPLSLEEAWAVLTDLSRVAPCLPGAQLDEVVGDEYRGRVRVKVGPITVEYRGTAHFVSRDEERHVAELRAEGRETRGQGNAVATVAASLASDGVNRTKISVHTKLDISGRVAQLGRGAIADVSARLLDQFVDNLERDLRTTPAREQGEANSGTDAETTRVYAASRPEAGEPVRALALLWPVLLKRLSPVAAAGAVVLLVRRLLKRRSGRGAERGN